MAKKRKAKKSVAKFVPFVLLGLAVLVICMGFLAGVTFNLEGAEPQSSTLFDITFGKVLVDLTIKETGNQTVFKFQFLAMLGLFLPLIGALVSLFVKNRIGGLVAFLLFVGSAVLLFLVPQYAGITNLTLLKGEVEKELFIKFADLEATLGVGTIIAGIGSCLGALVSLLQVAKGR